MNYVIIGNSAAAVGCIEGLRKNDTKASITVISDEVHHVYSRPLISYYLAGTVTHENMVYRKADFYEKMNVKTMLGSKATAIDAKKKAVTLENGETVGYDKLLIATGSSAFVPPIDGLDKQNNVFTFLKYDSALDIEKLIDKDAKVVIVGAGLIGLKAAEGLAPVSGSVHVVEMADRVLPMILDEQGAAPVQAKMQENGVTFHLGITAQKVVDKDRVEKVVLKDGTEIACDVLVMAVGVRPNVAEAMAAGVKANRGILVDENMRTNVDDIYAAGDVTEAVDVTTGEHKIMALWPNAYLQGRAAAYDMCSAEHDFDGVFPMNAVGFFGLPIITAGVQDGEDMQVLSTGENGESKRFIVKDDILVGMILVGDVDRAGIYTYLMSEKIPLSTLTKKLTDDDFGLMAFEEEQRNERLSS
ncbi:MAG: NAD(P)/FAD-dependent oxidoreductase [Clostridia bacterium]|jgi:NAD(P)H-nitrite reductase large subunit|nr:NAD(P)/FAD-dependent oxidoreductase [Clostridia bacterium]MBT7122979.1 NAD(P)/FAD-dependent oxidoreductase [Clostridia bacterium]